MKVSYLNDEFFSRLEALAFNLRSDLAGFFGGKHLVKTYGQTVEFADYREYQLGDDIRRIDWNLYSRFEKYFLKLFTDERQMHVRIFLDCSASMEKGDPRKSAYAVAMAAALGFLAVHNMDKVSFNLMKGNRAENSLGTLVGKSSFFRAVRMLEEIEFTDDTDLANAITSSQIGSRGDGMSVIISDFFTESDWKKAVDYLTYNKNQVLLVQVLSPEEIDPSYSGRIHMLDSESQDVSDPKNMKLRITPGMHEAYLEAMRDYKEDLRSFCVSRRADFFQVDCSQSLENMLFGQLLKVGIMG